MNGAKLDEDEPMAVFVQTTLDIFCLPLWDNKEAKLRVGKQHYSLKNGGNQIYSWIHWMKSSGRLHLVNSDVHVNQHKELLVLDIKHNLSIYLTKHQMFLASCDKLCLLLCVIQNNQHGVGVAPTAASLPSCDHMWGSVSGGVEAYGRWGGEELWIRPRALPCVQRRCKSWLVCTRRHPQQTGATALAPGEAWRRKAEASSGANDTWCYFRYLKDAPMNLRYWPKNSWSKCTSG